MIYTPAVSPKEDYGTFSGSKLHFTFFTATSKRAYQ